MRSNHHLTYNIHRSKQGLAPVVPELGKKKITSIGITEEALHGLQYLADKYTNANELGKTAMSHLLEAIGLFQLTVTAPTEEEYTKHEDAQECGFLDAQDESPMMPRYTHRHLYNSTPEEYNAYMRGYFEGRQK